MVKVPKYFPHCKQTCDQISFMLAALYSNVSVFYKLRYDNFSNCQFITQTLIKYQNYMLKKTDLSHLNYLIDLIIII